MMNVKRSHGPARPAQPSALAKPGKGESVQVVVRCRPMSRKEESQGHTQIIDMWPQRGIVHITKPRKAPGRASARMFTFDSVYDWNSNQDDLYENTVKPLVYSVLDGYNGTIFAYGQTGTGKTYTMLGSQKQQNQGTRERGISSKCFEDIFRHIAYTSDRTSYVVRASYFEIYKEETRDLLSPEPGQGDRRHLSLLLSEDAVHGVYVKGLQSVICKNIKAIERVMRVGNVNRATAATNMNEHSSRSHAIFQITIEMRDVPRRTGAKPGHGQGPLTAPVQGSSFRMGKLNLVDLAGSERQCKTGAVGDRLKESSKINLSLSALGNVISALVDGRGQGHRHIPYRDSKLTQLLQDSLGGNSKAIMIANIGPASYNYDESLMTLRYASRAKHIKNMPTRNVNAVNALASLGARGRGPRLPRLPRSALSHYNEEMRALKKLILAERKDSKGVACSPTTSSSEDSSSSTSADKDLGLGPRCCRQGCRASSAPSSSSSSPWSRSTPSQLRRHHRSHRRQVWKLHGKYHQETTVQMVRWIQEQMGSRGAASSAERNGQGDLAAAAARKESSAEEELLEELDVQRLVEDLSNAALKEKMMLSVAQMVDRNDRQTEKTRAFLKLASDFYEHYQFLEKKQQLEKNHLVSEEARLRKELALKNAIFQAYAAGHSHLPEVPEVISRVESFTDSCPIPTLVT